jgi:hypothetical protein
MRACISPISLVHGPAWLADTEAMNAIAPNTNNLEAVMMFSQLAHGMNFRIFRMSAWHVDVDQKRQNGGAPGDAAPPLANAR